ncbi:MAG TPA: HlyD family efflux transporter periplasmic adaptor subunit, partial [Pyrinomonadaceae bacterium]|nr:HlyD family efflux transporter periplasmic adaptor subunit [Pyrinomonadaceae bacterium]
LKVRAGTAGVLQQVSVQVGQQVEPGFQIARVADPTSLKAVLRVAETQISGVRIGQPVLVDTRNGIIQGKVSRIDPAAREGTVEIDASLIGPLPPSARPDLSVDGTIELERLQDVLKVGRPAFGQAFQTVKMFVLTPDGTEAQHRTVKLGNNSVSTIQILEGVREGEQVIISDTAQYDSYDRIRIR